MKGDNMFWMQFKIWFENRLLAGDYTTFTLKRLFLIFKNDYLPEYIRDKNGLHHAYMEMITFEDVFPTLLRRVVLPLNKKGMIVKVGRKKWRINGYDKKRKNALHPTGFNEKMAIREGDVSGGE